MEIKAFAACWDGGDGSTSVVIYPTRDEALKSLNRTEKQLEEGVYYDDGIIREVFIEIDNKGELSKSIDIRDIE